MRPKPTGTEQSTGPRHLVVKLREGWRLATGRGVFVGPDPPRVFDPSEEMPAGSRLEPMIPSLAGTDRSGLSSDERNLASYVHLILPESVRPEEQLDAVRAWPCVRDARLPPEVSLPGESPVISSPVVGPPKEGAGTTGRPRRE